MTGEGPLPPPPQQSGDGAEAGREISFLPRLPPPRLALPAGEIHLWALRLDPATDRVERLGEVLAGDEWERARRFRFERHRRRYVVGRGVLRLLLAAYLDLRPERVQFVYGPRGKPFLAPTQAACGLWFNLSNSDELALVGLVRGQEIGVDLELVKPMSDLEAIAERFFSPSERDVLRLLPQELKPTAFFNCWTRKEAYLKAVGEGLAAPLDSFDVTLAPGDPPRMLTLRGDPAAARRWTFHHFLPAPGYIGAVACEGPALPLRTWTWAH
jgi:4'-phosphopantetheinyl transferase